MLPCPWGLKSLKSFEEKGMHAAGINPEANLVEIMEYEKHPWFIGVQFHPEYSSTVASPHPLFVNFIKASLDFQKKNTNTKKTTR